jgi:hypothetical protein
VEDTAAHNQYPSAEPSRQLFLGCKTGPKTGGRYSIKQCFGASRGRAGDHARRSQSRRSTPAANSFQTVIVYHRYAFVQEKLAALLHEIISG